jgi:hypothetical protein
VVARVDGRPKDKAKQRSHHSVGLAHGARLAQDEMLQLAGLKWEPSREPCKALSHGGPSKVLDQAEEWCHGGPPVGM